MEKGEAAWGRVKPWGRVEPSGGEEWIRPVGKCGAVGKDVAIPWGSVEPWEKV